MPIYEFHCGVCGNDCELLVSQTEWEGTKCPNCQSTRLEKRLSVFAAPASEAGEDLPACSGNPGSCGRCSLD